MSELLVIGAWVVAVAVLLMDFLLVFFLWMPAKKNEMQVYDDNNLPMVSVLVAARNEEASLGRCLESLARQDYPAGKIEILVGNDRSTDGTQEVINSIKERHRQIKSLEIETNLGTAKGKSNVLAQLAKMAKGDVFLVTDADMVLPPGWCRHMVRSFTAKDGIVTGYTAVQPNGFFARMQALDWALAIGMIKVLTDLGQPVTSMGNNMAVLAEAYRKTGGYENMPFSITEDFQLTKAVLALGYSIRQVIFPEVTGLTLAASSLVELLHQRKRWSKGAVQLPGLVVFLLGMQAGYYIIVLLSVWLSPWLLVVLGLKAAVQALACSLVSATARKPVKIASLLLFEFYLAIISLSTLAFSVLPFRIKWKGRYY